MISLCMIVKNEESNLEGCISRIRPYVDEIVVVDTGSVDCTVEIAKSFGANVYHYEWDGNFSNARNFSISKAHNDWVLVLDADEFAQVQDPDLLRRFAADLENANRIGRIKRINVLDRDEQTTRQAEFVNRFFNRTICRYSGSIHEQLVDNNGKAPSTRRLELCVEHTGYTKASLSRTDKLNRNLHMLKRERLENPNDPYILYQIGKTLFMMHQWQDACYSFEKALKQRCDHRLEYMEDLVETYGYALLNDQKYEKALVIEQYMPYYEYLPDFRFLWALVLMNNARFDEAIAVFQSCMNETEGRTEGINSWLPAYNIAIIHEVLGRRLQALKYYGMCSDYEPARNRINGFVKR